MEGKNRSEALSFEDQICTPDLVIFLICGNQRLKERLLKRGEQQGHADDNLKATQRRLLNFKRNAMPLVKYFQEKGLIVTFDTDSNEDEVFYDNSLAVDNKLFQNKEAVAQGTLTLPWCWTLVTSLMQDLIMESRLIPCQSTEHTDYSSHTKPLALPSSGLYHGSFPSEGKLPAPISSIADSLRSCTMVPVTPLEAVLLLLAPSPGTHHTCVVILDYIPQTAPHSV
ncbi:Adenylate kinase isoenzyme 5 [Fukomys damarensis]|uniref:Adenylate kinase isoenzyme 5 n=1 Tax=Fukomys damarensis TaxID=885580 RepID=A0A091DFX8_FUKDA|nr:Adenylate kinase isoenzyme 5 [Fukomys damarensis]